VDGKWKLVDIWFVLRVWEFEANYGDFICANCIFVLVWWKILNLQLNYMLCWGSYNRKIVSC